MAGKTPQEVADEFARRQADVDRRLVPELLEPALGKAVRYLHDAGREITREALIEQLLQMRRERGGLPSEALLHAARHLGWHG